MSKSNHDLALLVEENAGLLEQGAQLIESIGPDTYRRNSHEFFTSGVGKHFRHVLDFYDRLIEGFGTIVDYESRKRDQQVESDPVYAVETARRHATALEKLASGSDDDPPAAVRLEVLDADGSGIETRSTIARELAALASHTIHHYAIIAMLLRVQGIEVDHSFGVAPSTIRFLAKNR